jgi:hypothetical protein
MAFSPNELSPCCFYCYSYLVANIEGLQMRHRIASVFALAAILCGLVISGAVFADTASAAVRPYTASASFHDCGCGLDVVVNNDAPEHGPDKGHGHGKGHGKGHGHGSGSGKGDGHGDGHGPDCGPDEGLIDIGVCVTL